MKMSQFQTEVDGGQRFEFGRNWTRFLTRLNDERIAIAQRSLVDFLGETDLEGKTFLDVGSGSGLFSLAARRLGANVRSFDFDPRSVACTRELKRRYFPEDPHWTVEEGSILDDLFVGQLGTYDIVYSWGVLHHTGQMTAALDNVKRLVALDGKLFIAIYNDLGQVTDQWAATKKRYNQLPAPIAFLFAHGIIAREEYHSLSNAVRDRRFTAWLKGWTEYDKLSTRGMSKWHDWIDWIGGWPYERATVESIVDSYAKDGFRLTKLQDRSSGYGCNEYVFRKEAELGTFIDNPIRGGRWLARSFGRRLPMPVRASEQGIAAQLPTATGERTWLMSRNRLLGPATISGKEAILGAHEAVDERAPHFVVQGERRVLEKPFSRVRDNMWAKSIPDLEKIADKSGTEQQSPVFVFEDGEQLAPPHTIHVEIAKLGAGRFSHWGTELYFSTSDNTNPNDNGRRYEIFIADPLS